MRCCSQVSFLVEVLFCSNCCCCSRLLYNAPLQQKAGIVHNLFSTQGCCLESSSSAAFEVPGKLKSQQDMHQTMRLCAAPESTHHGSNRLYGPWAQSILHGCTDQPRHKVLGQNESACACRIDFAHGLGHAIC